MLAAESNLQGVSSVQGAVGAELTSSLVSNTWMAELVENNVEQEATGLGQQITEPIGDFELGDWRIPLVSYLKDPNQTRDRKIRWQSLKYTLLDDELYHRTIDGLLLKCLGSNQPEVAMGEVHEGICGTHQLAHKMRWMLKRAGFYWATMLVDCFRYYKRCEACLKPVNIQLAPAAMLYPIVKPWPFRG